MSRSPHHQCYVLAAVMLITVAVLTAGCGQEEISPPVAKVEPVVNTYHGVDVTDPYQWMEDGSDPEVHDWVAGQDRYLRSVLDKVACRDEIAEELTNLFHQSSSDYWGFQYVNGKLFATKKQPPLDQSLLVVMDSPTDLSTERVVLDPNTLDTTGRTSISFYVVSPNGDMVAVALSVGGTEDGDVYVYKTATGEKLSDHVPRVNGPTAGGDVAWLADQSGFFYSRYPYPGERPEEDLRFYQQVWFHKLGDPVDKDVYAIGEEFPRIAEIEFETSPDHSRILAVVANGDGGEYGHFLWTARSKKWTQVTDYPEGVTTAKFGPDNSLYLLSSKGAMRGQILRLPSNKTKLADATVLVPEGDGVITAFTPTAEHLYVTEMLGGPSHLMVLDKDGSFGREVETPPIANISGVAWLDEERVLFRVNQYTEPPVTYVYDPAEGSSVRTAMAVTSPADFSNVEVSREAATSKDGTTVPMTVMHAEGIELNGNNPTILYGYGGYGSSQKPWFNEKLSLWLQRGGVYVIANIRGGGEYGEEWHLQGNLTKKQNVFDDFAACAEHLIEADYTNPERLAISGGSNGGLLVAATMVQHPDLFKAVVCRKGVIDMMRVELHPNGEFNTTEFGTVTNPDHFKALYAYCPYTNVKDSVAYPACFFTADQNDGRVDAYNARKMVAKLQAADPDGLYLLRHTTGGGHGIGQSMSDRLSQDTDMWAFLFDQLGVTCE